MVISEDQAGNVSIRLTMARVRVTTAAEKKQSIKYCVCVFLLYSSGLQIASFLHRVTLSPVACLSLQCFSKSYHTRYYFRGVGGLLNPKRVTDFSYYACLKHLSL
jgi:hypothetical protein